MAIERIERKAGFIGFFGERKKELAIIGSSEVLVSYLPRRDEVFSGYYRIVTVKGITSIEVRLKNAGDEAGTTDRTVPMNGKNVRVEGFIRGDKKDPPKKVIYKNKK